MSTVGIIQVGLGLIGRETISNLLQVRNTWRKEFGLDVVFRSFLDTSGGVTCDEPGGYTDEATEAILAEKVGGTPAFEAAALVGLTPRATQDAVDLALSIGTCIVVDAASGDDSADISFAAVTHGSGAVFSNKAPLSLPGEDQRTISLWNESDACGLVRYEVTCGAGLPVISTLRSLLATGDVPFEIVGTLSGTLGAILAGVDRGQSFSHAVREAAARGYTEPDPRDDLSGLDVARKALILGRTMGRDLDLADIEIERLVPDSLADTSVDEFLSGVDVLDKSIEQRVSAARQDESALKYVARIGADGPVKVGLEPVPRSTIVGATNGPENVVEIRTSRYDQYPLSVVGPGAGAAVTAAGVTADILDLALHLGVS